MLRVAPAAGSGQHDGVKPIAPMLATAGELPVGGRWAFEMKWDGVRAIVAAGPDGVRAWSRNGNDITAGYPELEGLRELVDEALVLDGELVALDRQGRPSFELLQARMHLRNPGAELLASVPVNLFVFDVLRVGGNDLTGYTYLQRREALAQLALEHPPAVRVPPHYVDQDGAALLAAARDNGLEGVVAKRVDSRYLPGKRSRDWIKHALRLTQEVIVGGWVEGQGRRAGTIGALLLGVTGADGELEYAGDVGTGWSDHALRDLQQRLGPLERDTSPFSAIVARPRSRVVHWVEPSLIGEVEHRQWTGDRRLRHPSWRGLRVDKKPIEVRHDG
jgi:bifunctional non-homologous end joining protein LigD